MEIKEAIIKTGKIIDEQKKQLLIQRQSQAEEQAEERVQEMKKEQQLAEKRKCLFQRLREKANGLVRDKETVEGIKFLEDNGLYFTLESGYKHAFYLCANGSFKKQRWGMYLGNDYITPAKNGDFDIDTLGFINSLNFKELLVKQIQEIPKNKRFRPEDSFKEMFG